MNAEDPRTEAERAIATQERVCIERFLLNRTFGKICRWTLGVLVLLYGAAVGWALTIGNSVSAMGVRIGNAESALVEFRQMDRKLDSIGVKLDRMGSKQTRPRVPNVR